MKTSKKILLNLNLEPDFVEKLRETMKDELKVASKKWGVRLTDEDSASIVKHSEIQLKRRVSEAAKIPWDFGQIITVRVNANGRDEVMELPDPNLKEPKLAMAYTRDGWELAREEQEDIVTLDGFLEHFNGKLHTWARTAVFYGVGSYSK